MIKDRNVNAVEAIELKKKFAKVNLQHLVKNGKTRRQILHDVAKEIHPKLSIEALDLLMTPRKN